MYRILLSVSFGFLLAFNSAAQCVPDTNVTHNVNGIYPDTVTGLPHATQGQVYTTTIQLKVVRDTTYNGLPATVDSMNITGVTGLPPGFSYLCTPSNCSFPGGSNACILLQSGTPVTAAAGTYPLNVGLTVYGRVFGVPATVPSAITGYSIVVDPLAGILNTTLPTRLSVSEFSPNPVSRYSRIVVGVPEPGDIRMETIDLLGNIVRREKFDATRGWNTYAIDVEDLPAGVYLTRVGFGKDLMIRRMVVTAH